MNMYRENVAYMGSVPPTSPGGLRTHPSCRWGGAAAERQVSQPQNRVHPASALSIRMRSICLDAKHRRVKCFHPLDFLKEDPLNVGKISVLKKHYPNHRFPRMGEVAQVLWGRYVTVILTGQCFSTFFSSFLSSGEKQFKFHLNGRN